MKKLRQILKWLRAFLFPTRLERINKKLKKVALREEKKRLDLKIAIRDHVRKKYNVTYDKRSKFIPIKGLKRFEVFQDITHRFETQLRDSNLQLTTDLRFK